MQHVTTNVLIDFDAEDENECVAATAAATDRARIRANIVAHLCEGADPNPVAARGGVSLGKAVRTPEGWRLTELEARPTWATRPREHALHG
jgi:hypothetical protein